MSGDTIAAIATAPGRGAIGILRLSGPQAAAIAAALAGRLPEPRRAGLRVFRDPQGARIDEGLVLLFPAPQSYTGETLVELQGHGGPVVLDALLAAACAAGARPARPGEFTERAYLNGRLDLAQAEAVADLIDAGSRRAAQAAARALSGEFSQRVDTLVETLIGLRADLEAALDFSDEDLPWLTPAGLVARLAALKSQLAELRAAAGRGRRLREGLVVAIAGRPNVGKSTLMNRLAGEDVAIVSPLAGTTRDTLRESLVIDGLPLTLIDTAGIRDTEDPIEREGVARARAALARAELALLVVEDGAAEDAELLASLPPALPRLVLRNKCDVSGQPPGLLADGSLRLSAASGAGVELLRAELLRAAGLEADAETPFLARARHVDALNRAAMHVDAACAAAGAELIAEELRLAQCALDEITGRFGVEDLLGRIFASFCIGK